MSTEELDRELYERDIEFAELFKEKESLTEEKKYKDPFG